MTRTINPKSMRNVAAAAASLALTTASLTGCSDSADEASLTEETAELDIGLPWVYGDVPQRGPEASSIERAMTFAPKYYAVVYLRFDEGAHLLARHAYFQATGGQMDRVACAIGYLRSYSPTSGASDPACPPYTDATRKRPVSEDFEDFRFGSQQRVYVFVDNEDVSFNPAAPLSFTPFGAFDTPEVAGPGTMDPNLSFYNAKLGPLGDLGREGLQFDNFYRGKGGKPIPDGYSGSDSSEYSMNFNLLVCRERGQKCDFADRTKVIPLAIDPDTGNGWGSKP